MARKSKASSIKEDGAAKASKKIKVSDDNDDDDEQEVDEGPWDGIRVIAESETVACRSCKAQATATWESQKTGDKWDMCDKCQMEDFGECFTGNDADAAEDHKTKSTSDDVVMQDQQVVVDDKTQDPSPCDDSIKEKLPPSEDAAKAGAPAKPCGDDDDKDKSCTTTAARTDKDPSANDEATDSHAIKSDLAAAVSEDSAASDSASVASSRDDITGSGGDSDKKEEDAVAPIISQTQGDDAPMADAAEESEQDEEDEDDVQYDLKKILSLDELLNNEICCSQDCGLAAFGLYVNSKDPKDRWFYCLDCQENDFDGWPPVEELPVKYLAPEHLRVIASKCSEQKNPPMPVFSSSSSDSTALDLSPKGKRNDASTNDAKTTCGTANFVTPPPPSLLGSSKEENSLVNSKPVNAKAAATASKALEARYKTWMEQAQEMGGKDARIVVSKPAAKKIIFDFLYDAFQPMNITQIYKGLKAVVPQGVLSACLSEMVPDKFDSKNQFADSDDEGGDDEKKLPPANKENLEPYSASLVFKPGRNPATNLYFVDYTKVKGLDRDERDALVNDLAAAKAEEQGLNATLASTKELTAKLLAEPTNEELTLKLEAEERLLQELEEKLAEAQKLKVNEKHKEKTKRRIQHMAAQWRQRRRSCLEFLTSLEENTDGSISRSKCLKGDGPISLDSDEAVAKAAVQFAKDKRSRANARGGLHKMRKRVVGRGGNGEPGNREMTKTQALESDLVAVTLDSQLNIVRVYATED